VKGKGKPCCKETEEKERRQLVSAILKSAYFSSDEEREDCVNIYAKSLMTLEEIINITEPLREMGKQTAKSRARIFGSNSRAMGGIA
jgi:NH3-dependent NAD+ synthetase